MKLFVRDVMNRQIFAARIWHQLEEIQGALLKLHITTVPVIADDKTLSGMISLRDIVQSGPGQTVADVMISPALTVDPDASIEAAGQTLCRSGLHHAAVTDDKNQVIGFLSLMDLMRGLVGLESQHPRPPLLLNIG